MRQPSGIERDISALTGITDLDKVLMIECYMRDMIFFPRKFDSVTRDEFIAAALLSVKELEGLGWNFI